MHIRYTLHPKNRNELPRVCNLRVTRELFLALLLDNFLICLRQKKVSQLTRVCELTELFTVARELLQSNKVVMYRYA